MALSFALSVALSFARSFFLFMAHSFALSSALSMPLSSALSFTHPGAAAQLAPPWENAAHDRWEKPGPLWPHPGDRGSSPNPGAQGRVSRAPLNLFFPVALPRITRRITGRCGCSDPLWSSGMFQPVGQPPLWSLESDIAPGRWGGDTAMPAVAPVQG